MSFLRSANALRRCQRCIQNGRTARTTSPSTQRFLSISRSHQADLETASSIESPINLDPLNPITREEEQALINAGKYPVSSRRRRAAIQSTPGIPFEQLPYQCFQEARKVIADYRTEVIKKIDIQKDRIARLKEQDPAISGGKIKKQHRLDWMSNALEKLIIEADIHDPRIKMKFEDGSGDMNKPIYRYLADQKWREYKRKIVMQRVEQMHVIPDLIPYIDAVASVEVSFPGCKVQPGEFVDSRHSQVAPNLNIQVFDASPRLVTIAVVDSDVPNEETDSFDRRCHGIYANIEISPTEGRVYLNQQKYADFIVLPWIPPTAQKGTPYHRLTVIVMQHLHGQKLDVGDLKDKTEREGFHPQAFMAQNKLKGVGITMFRTQWDEGMELVMNRHGISGADVAWKRKIPEKLPYKKKDGKRYR